MAVTPRRNKSARTRIPPIQVDAHASLPLGMPAEQFLRDYWQKRPLLVRNAFPGLVAPLQPEDLAGLACEDGVLARLVEHDRATDGWRVRHGPFPEELFPALPTRDWTLLVQDVDKWDADVAALLPAFSFLPRWRIDDIMVSFAAPGGSVGAHVDQYDVFLIQGQGHRRWQIDASSNPPLQFRPGVDLKLLQQFNPDHEWVLAPGDMLYLPPGVPHHGIAEDACLTYSLGMRAPSAADLLGDFVDTLAADADDSLRFRDPDLAPALDPNEIDADAMRRVVDALNLLRMNDPARLGDWFGGFITRYRSPGELVETPVPARIETEWLLQQGTTLLRHPYSRMAWRRQGRAARLYANGETFELPVADARRLAGAGVLDNTVYSTLSEAGRDVAFSLYEAGHYRPFDDDDDKDDPA